LCILTIANYIVIAFRFWAVFESKEIATALISIFLFCAACGYMPIVAAQLLDPNSAYTMRLIGLLLLQPACWAFVAFSKGQTFQLHQKRLDIGKKIESEAEFRNMSTDDLIGHAIHTLEKLKK